MSLINTTLGEMDESLLAKHEDVLNNANEKTTSVEYCLVGCKGPAHITNVPDSEAHFCGQHVHRSVHVTLKKNLTADGAAASFGNFLANLPDNI